MRIYEDKYLSVTSIIELRKPFNKQSFVNWCESSGLDCELISKTSSILGDKVSECLNDVSKGFRGITAPPIDMLESNLYSAVDDFLKEWDLISTEKEVVCEELMYAGRYDGVVKKKGTHKTMLVDWKTFGAWQDKPYKRVSSKIKKVKWQLSMYAYAMDWKQSLGVVIFKNDGSWELEEVAFDNEMIEWVQNNQKLILDTIQGQLSI
jgi:hypothetical protein